MTWVLICGLVCQAHRGPPLAGVLLCRSTCQALKRAPQVGSYSAVQYVRHLMGQPLYCSAASAGIWGERGYADGSTPTYDSAVSSCFHGCWAFFYRRFPLQSPLSDPHHLSLHSQQQPSPWDCSTIPKLQLPAAAPSRASVACLEYVWLPQGLSDSHSI